MQMRFSFLKIPFARTGSDFQNRKESSSNAGSCFLLHCEPQAFLHLFSIWVFGVCRRLRNAAFNDLIGRNAF